MDSIKTTAAALPAARSATTRSRLLYLAALMGLSALVAVGMTWLRLGEAGVSFADAALQPHAPDLALLTRQPTVIQVHLYAALLAVMLGAVMMLARKGRTFHRAAGWIWVTLILLVAGSSLFITGLNGDKWSFIHLLAGWTIIAAPIGLIAARRHKVKQHRRTMMGLFYGGVLIAGAFAFSPGRLMWNLFLG
jgi:uncharacterized membrane protein